MIDFTVQPDVGEPFEVKADSRDVYVWEKAGRGRSMGQLMANMPMVDLYAVAHIAARRQQLFTGTLDEFAATCALHFEPDDDDDQADADPTRPVR